MRGGGGHGHRGGGGWGGLATGLAIGVATGIILSQPPAGATEAAPQRAQRPNQPQRNARGSGVPAAGETRMVPDEVVIELPNTVPAATINSVQQRHRLTRLESQTVTLTGTTFYRWRIPDRRSVAAVVRALEADTRIASAQPNYRYTLQQDVPKAEPAALSPDKPAGAATTQSFEIKAKIDPLQYAVLKMRLDEAHGLAKGDNVLVAVIDSGIDANHPELAGSVADSLDTVQSPFAPHDHGTGIAALIAGRERLTGASPGARILAVRAFDPAGSRRGSHDLQHPQGARLVGGEGRAHHQYELCRPGRSGDLAQPRGCPQEKHHPDRGRRQCRRQVAAALSGGRSERDRRDRDRQRRQAVPGLQPRPSHCGRRAGRRRADRGGRMAATRSRPARRSRRRRSAARLR